MALILQLYGTNDFFKIATLITFYSCSCFIYSLPGAGAAAPTGLRVACVGQAPLDDVISGQARFCLGLTERTRDGGGGERASLRGLVTAVGVSGSH